MRTTRLYLQQYVARWRGRCMARGQRAGGWVGSTPPTRAVLARVQRLEPFIALMLIRQRLPLTDATGGAQHSALGAAAMALPSGLLAMVCAAMLKLESKLDVRAG